MAPKGNDQAVPHRPRPARDVTPSSRRSSALAGSPKTARRASLNGVEVFRRSLTPSRFLERLDGAARTQRTRLRVRIRVGPSRCITTTNFGAHRIRAVLHSPRVTRRRVPARLWRSRLGRRGQKPSRSTTKVTQVHPARVGCCCKTRGQVQRLVQLRAGDGGLLPHVTKDGALGPRGDQGIGDSIDPDPGAAAITAFLAGDSLEREDAVCTRELAEAQGHHSSVRRHADILTLPTPLRQACLGAPLEGAGAVSADEMRPSAAFWPADRPDLTHAVTNPTSHRPRGRASPPGSKAKHHSGPRQQLLTSAAKDAELVTFWVCQYDPRLITLTNINTLCAMGYQTSHLSVLVIRPEVEMQSALSLLALIKPDEVQPRQAIRLRADLELLSRRVDHHPTKRLRPPLPQGHRVDRVNNHLFPFQGHPPNLDRPGLQEQAFGSEKTLVRTT